MRNYLKDSRREALLFISFCFSILLVFIIFPIKLPSLHVLRSTEKLFSTKTSLKVTNAFTREKNESTQFSKGSFTHDKLSDRSCCWTVLTLLSEFCKQFVQHQHFSAVGDEMRVSGVRRARLSTIKQVWVVTAFPQLHQNIQQTHLIHFPSWIEDINIFHQDPCVPEVL